MSGSSRQSRSPRTSRPIASTTCWRIPAPCRAPGGSTSCRTGSGSSPRTWSGSRRRLRRRCTSAAARSASLPARGSLSSATIPAGCIRPRRAGSSAQPRPRCSRSTPRSAPARGAGGSGEGLSELGHYSRGLHSPKTGRKFRAATPPLFSFNSPLGACPRCRGFGRVIDIDYRLAIPDPSLSIDAGAIRCWEGAVYGASKDDLRVFARRKKIPTDVPFERLSPEQRAFVVDGEPDYGAENGKEWPKYWYGVKGFFRWLEKNTYKMHVRVFLSRYRSYNPCPACGGSRLQPEALCWRWQGLTLPELYKIPVDRLLELVSGSRPAAGVRQAELAFDSILARLRYLREVGLGYLTADRPSRTLSGGEVERVNLTGCLGTSLVDTLFVLDEPSVGLHPRDIDRLVAIIRSLVAAGNTVVVVEHDESMIRAADHVIEIGPEPGARGGHVVFEGTVERMLRDAASITGAYFSGRRRIASREARRPVGNGHAAIEFLGASKHNIRSMDARIPLRR